MIQARAEAEYVLDQIDGYLISYPVAFDIEDTVHRQLTTKERTDITIAFLEVIVEAGYYPMIYASENWLNTMMDLSRLTKYDKWVARWGDSVSYTPLAMWQYSAAGTVDGISGDVDLDYSYRDYSKIITPRMHANERKVQTGWQTDGSNYWYVEEDGTIPKRCFKTIDGKTYYFNAKGYRTSGWVKSGGQYYYFRKTNGAMYKGWLKQKGKYYYLSKKNGVLKTGWLTLGTRKYYLGTNGVRYGGWLKYEGNVYYLNKSNGRMRTGWWTIRGKTYYFHADGRRASGVTRIDGKLYYFKKKNGVLVKNRTLNRYVADADGVLTRIETVQDL